MSFDITNYDYYDLEKAAPQPSAEAREGASLLQNGELLGEVMTLTIGKVYEELIWEGLHNASRAPPAFGSSAPLPGSSMPSGWAASSPEATAAAADPSEEQVDVYVTFRLKAPHQRAPWGEFLQARAGAGAATTIEVVITDKPRTGANLLPEVGSILVQSQADGLLRRRMKTALFQATGVNPRIAGLSAPPVPARLEQWQEGACERHVERLVGLMEVAYTRRMVPLALFNECTNFIPAMSFSHDPVATRLDRAKCRSAAVKFARRWDYGRAGWRYGAGEGRDATDLSAFCSDVCKTRFGEGAPQCSVNRQLQQGA